MLKSSYCLTVESGQWRVDNGEWTIDSGKWREAIRETRNTKH